MGGDLASWQAHADWQAVLMSLSYRPTVVWRTQCPATLAGERSDWGDETKGWQPGKTAVAHAHVLVGDSPGTICVWPGNDDCLISRLGPEYQSVVMRHEVAHLKVESASGAAADFVMWAGLDCQDNRLKRATNQGEMS